MARARTIKPSFFKNDDLVEIDPLGRLLFIGLWTIADREGRLEDRPKKIKMEILPADSCDVDAFLAALQDAGFITRYEVDGKRYIQINNFSKHQNPHPRETGSEIPPIPAQNDAEEAQSREIPQQSNAEEVVCHEEDMPNHGKDMPRTCLGNAKDTPSREKALPSNAIPSFTSIPSISSFPSFPSCHSDTTEVVVTSLPDKETEEEEKSILSGKPDVVHEIVDYLNGRTGAAYRAASKKTRTLINARLKEGFSREDFFSVIDKKAEEWSGTEFQAYLRPETLFGTKFESYLNQKVARKRPSREPPMNPQIAMALRAIEMLDGGTDDDAGSENY